MSVGVLDVRFRVEVAVVDVTRGVHLFSLRVGVERCVVDLLGWFLDLLFSNISASHSRGC